MEVGRDLGGAGWGCFPTAGGHCRDLSNVCLGRQGVNPVTGAVGAEDGVAQPQVRAPRAVLGGQQSGPSTEGMMTA